MDAETVRQKPLFSIGSDVYRWEDVVRLARRRGDWDAVADDVRAGLVALRELERRGRALGDEEIEAARREFRYARGLLSGDELSEWLDRRGVDFSDWQGYIERRIGRERVPDPPAVPELEPGEVEPRLWPEAVCSGRLDELAETLARLLAVVAPGTGLEGLDEAFESFSRSMVSDRALAHEIDIHRLEWIRIDYETAAFDDEDAALEAALCVRNDGMSLESVATRAGATLERRMDWLEDLEQELASRILAARPGELIGPLAVAEQLWLTLVREKITPTADDDEVRARAADAVVERAVEHEANERVVWLDAL